MRFHEFITTTVLVLEAAGVVVIVGGIVGVAVVTAWTAFNSVHRDDWYRRLRQGVGRAILLGLELLVGADIIRTVAEQPTWRSVTVLAGVVLIRTFLSFTLEVELEGRWPWHKKAAQEGGHES